MKQINAFKEDTKLFDALGKLKVKCVCSHTKVIPAYIPRLICDYCGKWVYRDKKLEFKEKVKEKLK